MNVHPGANVPSATEREIASQPDAWQRAADVAREFDWPAAGARVALVGCGSSWFAGIAIARLREAAGLGETDAFASSEAHPDRAYQAVLAISRSGTTTETLDVIRRLGDAESVAIVASRDTPIARATGRSMELDFATEESVVQTRFVTSCIALGRAWCGESLEPAVRDARRALEEDLPLDTTAHDHYVFLGSGWCLGLAAEAALVARECAGVWTEAHPCMEYRHGPIAAARPGTAAWFFGPSPAGLADEIAATGATVVEQELDPLASLVHVQRVAMALAAARGRDVDRPEHLTRAIVLESPN